MIHTPKTDTDHVYAMHGYAPAYHGFSLLIGAFQGCFNLQVV